MARKAKPPANKTVEALRHEEAKRRNIPTAEYQSVMQKEAQGSTPSSSGAARTTRTRATWLVVAEGRYTDGAEAASG